METITIYCVNHQCLKRCKCARYAANKAVIGGREVRRFTCERSGYDMYVKMK